MRCVKKGMVLFVTPSIALQVVAADIIQEGRTYASPLPFGHHYQPSGPVGISGKHGTNGQMSNQLAVDRCNKILCGWGVREV
jgi:hypothetical protein